MKITEIKPAVKNKNKCNIYIDGEYKLSMFSSDVAEFSLYEGMTLNKNLYDKLNDTTVYKNALNECIKMLSRTDYPSKRIIEKLTLKDYPEQVITDVISNLTKKGYINDYEYAKKYIEKAMTVKKKGRAYIELELYRHGIEREHISELLEMYYNSNELKVIAKGKLEKILNEKEKADYKDIKKIKEYLFRQGFSFDEINKTIDELLKGTEII